MTKRAILIGSTGLVGNLLLDELIASKHYSAITTFSRRTNHKTSDKLAEHIIDFDDLDTHRDRIQGDDLFITLGTTIKKAGSQENFYHIDYEIPLQFATIARENGIKNVYVISAIGANPLSKMHYNRTKGELEESLKALDFPSLSIFRPSLIIGDRPEFRFGEKMGEYLLRIINPLLVGKARKYRAISAKTIAKSLCLVAQKENDGVVVYYFNE